MKSILFLAWCLLVFAMLPVPATAAPRIKIHPPDDCDFVASSKLQAHDYVRQCAMAIQRIRVSPLEKQCSVWGEPDNKNLSLYDLMQKMQEAGRAYKNPQFHAFSRGRFLLEIPCNEGAYNQSSVFYRYDESRLPARIELVQFPQADGSFKPEIGSRQVGTQQGLIVVYRKERGQGDSGYYARYAVNKKSLQITLLEAIEKKDQWDGQDPFNWRGRWQDKPQGNGWERIYPHNR